MGFVLFLVEVFLISFSGAMQPDPLTAAVVKMGTRNRCAGALLALGHAVIELPVMILIILGMAKLFESQKTQIIIGLAGGIFLLIMAIQMMRNLQDGAGTQDKPTKENPVLTGIILSAGNPYFLIWWATIGLALAVQAKGWGTWAFAIFALVHWSVDLIWLQALSWASFKGSAVLGPRSYRIVLMICAIVLLAFGLFFICSAAVNLIGLI